MILGPPIVTNGIVLSLDAADRVSYPGSGTTWRDMSGNRNNGTLTNGPTFSSANGGSIVFDGVNDRLDISVPASYTGFTFIFVLNFNVTQSQGFPRILYSSDGTTQHEIDSSQYYYRFRWGGGLIDSAQNFIIPNQTNIYAFTYVSPNLIWYRNGISYSTASISSAGTFTFVTIMNRSNDSARPLNGSLFCAQMYSRALTSAEILQNYNAQKTRFGLT